MSSEGAGDEALPALWLHYLHTAASAAAQDGKGSFIASPRPEPVSERVAAAALLEWPGPTQPVGGCAFGSVASERPDLADVVGGLPVRLDARGRQLVVLNEDLTAELLSIRVCLVEIRGGWDRDTGCPIIAVQAPQQFGAGTGKASGIWLIAVAAAPPGAYRVLAALSAIGGIRSDFGAVYCMDPSVAGAGATSEMHKAYERPAEEADRRAPLAQPSPPAWWRSCWAAEDPTPTELEAPEGPARARPGAAPGAAATQAQAQPGGAAAPLAAPAADGAAAAAAAGAAQQAPPTLAARLVREGGRNGAGAGMGSHAGASAAPEGLHEGLHCVPFLARDALPMCLEEELFILSAVQGHPNVARLHGLFFLAGEDARRRAWQQGDLEGGEDDEEDEFPIVGSCYGGAQLPGHAADVERRGRDGAPVWALVTDYYLRGNLYKCLGRVPSEVRTLEVMRGLLGALHHIHDRGVIHRDVKIEHVFVSEVGRPVLADFESACWADDRREICRRVGTPGYIAPEMYMERVYNEKVDVFAAGVVMFYALSRVLPFLGGNSASTQRRTCHLEVEFARYAAFDPMSRGCRDLLQWMLVKRPSHRPHAEEALDHAWFTPEGLGPHAPPLLPGRFTRRPKSGGASPVGGSPAASASPPLPPSMPRRQGSASGSPVGREATAAESDGASDDPRWTRGSLASAEDTELE